MNAEDRKTILWIGDNIPNALTRELERRGRLQIKSISEAALPADAPSARTLLLQFTGNAAQFISRVRRCRPIALGHGLGIGLVYRSESDLGEFARVTGFFDQTHRDINEKNGKAQTRIITFIPQDWAETAEWIARYDAGPGAKENMELTGAIVAELDDEEQLLLRRSFQGLPGIHVIELAGGYSQARILTVRPHRGTGEPTRRRLAYFAKIDLLRRVIGEIDRNERFVMDLIPFDQRPNLHARLFAYGDTKAIMAGDFVDHAVPLSDLFGKFKAEGIISGSLLYGALEEWRFDAGLANLSLLNEFRRLKVLRPANELDDHGKARAQSIRSAKHHGVCMSERNFWKTVETLPPTRTRYCIIHGDLHAGNILVRVSPLNTFLIDFSKAENGPAVADPACLEVSLSFRFNEQFDPAFISKLYSYPCEVPDESIHSYEQESLLEIVQAIRRSGCWNEEGCFAYVFALVAYLFNFASYSTYPIERRRLAYYLSQRLLLDLQTSVRATK